ncbi:hypothetical protein [Sphingomonas sp. BK069]|uniref:hypothetical protein n=1 Tax=Sphingomonas sp. BK069 TaxID=2586979 RepID=UPI00161FC02C|nr:hypothetical protein [Sphingomonas sp. BK069]MBB3349813.1 hypothetical protein [Sphingomonas sp. BK069]
MPLQLFLNELTLTAEDLSHAEAVRMLKGIVEVAKAARAVSGAAVLNCECAINALPLGANFTVAAVRNAGDCVTETLFLKTLQDRAPLNQALQDPGAPDASNVEYKLPEDSPVSPGAAAQALGLSHLLDGLTVSLPTHAHWRGPEVPLDRLELLGNGELQSAAVIARNAYCADDVSYHSEALRQLSLPQFSSGAELWLNREALLPRLRFIPRTRAQIEGILEGDPVLESVWGKLMGIDRAIETWRRTGGARPRFPFNVRPESRSRMGLVAFNDADGNSRAFSDHTDFAPGEGRIHFIVGVEPDRHALIGHVGRKLGIG